jgi:hypothetical protein
MSKLVNARMKLDGHDNQMETPDGCSSWRDGVGSENPQPLRRSLSISEPMARLFGVSSTRLGRPAARGKCSLRSISASSRC